MWHRKNVWFFSLFDDCLISCCGAGNKKLAHLSLIGIAIDRKLRKPLNSSIFQARSPITFLSWSKEQKQTRALRVKRGKIRRRSQKKQESKEKGPRVFEALF
jgi:hypothetical protein